LFFFCGHLKVKKNKMETCAVECSFEEPKPEVRIRGFILLREVLLPSFHLHFPPASNEESWEALRTSTDAPQ
jgi:hypothetical protein